MSLLEICLVVYVVQLLLLISQLVSSGFRSRLMFYFGFVPGIWLLWYVYVFFHSMFVAMRIATFDFKSQKKKMEICKDKGYDFSKDIPEDRPSKRRYRKKYNIK